MYKRQIETFTDSEREQPMGDKEETEAIITEKEIVEEDAQGDQPDKAEARRGPNWQDMMRFIAEKFDKIEENSRKQNETLSEKFDKIDENFKKQEENSRKQNETLRDTLKQIEKINEENLRC